MQTERSSRKFKDIGYFATKEEASDYYLLPFRFHAINAFKDVIVNETGDFLIVPKGSVERIILHRVKRDEELYGDLVANFFISDEETPPLLDIIATKYRTKKSFLDNFTALHIFVISLRCEHTCHYCQVSRVTENKDAFDMSRHHIDEGIRMMMQSPNPNVTMEFQGGEALLAFDNIVYAVERAKVEADRYKKNVSFVICTNLAPVTEDILIYCRDNRILISTSLDGPDYVHNKNRHRPANNSYELATRGITLCREILGPDSVSALLTTTNLSLNHPYEIVDEYYKRGFHSIFLRPISPYGFATHNAAKNKYNMSLFLDFYKKALGRVLDYNLEGYYMREDYATVILRKILTPFPVGYVDLQSPAGMINNVIVFNYNGNVYATDESRMLAETGDDTFLLGRLGVNSYNEIFYGAKTVELSDAMLNESLPGCSDCAFQSYCGADPVLNHATQGDVIGHRPTSVFCQKNMEIIRYLLELMDSDSKIEQIFRSWVRG